VTVVSYLATSCIPRTELYMTPLMFRSLMVPAILLLQLLFIRGRKLRPAQEREAA